MYRPVTLEAWASGPVRAPSGAQADRATLTLYLHVPSQHVLSPAVDYVTTDVPGDALRVPAVHDADLDWFAIRIAVVATSLLTTGSLPDRPACR
jgi:hypothetical protein